MKLINVPMKVFSQGLAPELIYTFIASKYLQEKYTYLEDLEIPNKLGIEMNDYINYKGKLVEKGLMKLEIKNNIVINSLYTSRLSLPMPTKILNNNSLTYTEKGYLLGLYTFFHYCGKEAYISWEDSTLATLFSISEKRIKEINLGLLSKGIFVEKGSDNDPLTQNKVKCKYIKTNIFGNLKSLLA